MGNSESERALIQANIDEAIKSFIMSKDEDNGADMDSEVVTVSRPDDEERYSKVGKDESKWAQQVRSMESTKQFGAF